MTIAKAEVLDLVRTTPEEVDLEELIACCCEAAWRFAPRSIPPIFLAGLEAGGKLSFLERAFSRCKGPWSGHQAQWMCSQVAPTSNAHFSQSHPVG